MLRFNLCSASATVYDFVEQRVIAGKDFIHPPFQPAEITKHRAELRLDGFSLFTGNILASHSAKLMRWLWHWYVGFLRAAENCVARRCQHTNRVRFNCVCDCDAIEWRRLRPGTRSHWMVREPEQCACPC